MKKSFIALIIVAGAIVIGIYGLIGGNAGNSPPINASVQSHPTYSLDLASGTTYPAGQVTTLEFVIRDEQKNIQRNFDTVHEKQMHLIVVRIDRTNFQHVHPAFDSQTGVFKITDFTFPTDGGFRVFADFTARSAQRGPDGAKLPSTPYQDVIAGDYSRFSPMPIGGGRVDSSAGGFSTKLVLASGDQSGASIVADTDANFAINIRRDDEDFKDLETYLGALGHMVILGPKLEFIHAHTAASDGSGQDGYIRFMANFPVKGQHKLFLQTKAAGEVMTTDYVVSVRQAETKKKPETQPMSDMKEMEH